MYTNSSKHNLTIISFIVIFSLALPTSPTLSASTTETRSYSSFLETSRFSEANKISSAWVYQSPMPTARSEMAAVKASNGKIYVIGGRNSNTLSIVEEYNPVTDSWRRVADMPTPRCQLAAAATNNGKIYVIGGGLADQLVSYDTVEEYDLGTNTWRSVASLLTPRFSPTAVTGSDGKIYVIGGWKDWTTGFLNSVEVYDPTTNTWEYRASMQQARDKFAAVATENGLIYAMGGYVHYFLNTVEEYNIETDTWRYLASMPSVRMGLAAVITPNDKIYAIGGQENYNGNALTTVFEYDPITNVWNNFDSLNTERWLLAAATNDNGDIYAIGGWDSNFSYLNSLEVNFIGSLPDIGFRPNPDGYHFDNYLGVYPLVTDYSIEDAIKMFGKDAICIMVNEVCFPRFQVLIWIAKVNWDMNFGHCDGMASTSSRFFKEIDDPSAFQPDANTTFDLNLGNVRRHIAYYFVEQYTDPVRTYKEQIRQNSLSSILNQLISAMSNGAEDPTTLFIRHRVDSEISGHAITPYAIEDRGNGIYWVKVYDNNHASDSSRYVIINTSNNTWSYDFGGTIWSGDDTTHTLGIVPISEYAKQPVCPWCDSDSWAALPTSLGPEIWLTGQGHLLITDSQGQRIGYLGDQFINEIAGAFESPIDAGLGVAMEPIYDLPQEDDYQILLDGQTLTEKGETSIAVFAPGYAVSIADITIGPASQDELKVSQDGTAVVYQANEAREPTITIALDSASESRQFTILEADFSAGDTGGMTADLNLGKLEFDNSLSAGGEYNFSYKLIDENRQRIFTHSGIDIPANATHYLDFGKWDGSTSMILEVDLDSDGDIDEYIDLDNQANRIYLPFTVRSQ